MQANREVYGNTLVELAKYHQNLLVLDADLAMATYTKIFKQAFPDKFVECGIAESNMMAVAAGLAASGMMPFVSTFAIFASLRAAEQFRNSVCYPHLNVKVAATHGGVECGADGATHQAIEDLAVMRAMPGNTVLVPSDPVSTRALLFAAAGFDGPCYLRMGRDKVNQIYSENTSFDIGGSNCLKSGNDAAILAIGSRVEAALQAARLLEDKGIRVSVFDMYSIKPIDKSAIARAALCKNIITVEDHGVVGGLGSAVCQEICESGYDCKIKILGIQDSFGRSGTSKELFEFYHIAVNDIVDAVEKLI